METFKYIFCTKHTRIFEKLYKRVNAIYKNSGRFCLEQSCKQQARGTAFAAVLVCTAG